MDRSPMQVLESETALTMTQLAYVTGGLFTKGRNKGQPDRRRGLELVESGAVKPIDPSQPVHRLKVWTDEARRYLAEGPRRDAQPLRSVS